VAADDAISLPLLDRVRIAAPCPARWEEMTGDDRVRHCGLCRLNVYNLSGMSRGEAEALLSRHFEADGASKGERVCAQVFRRADGTVMTTECPVGLAAVRARARRAAVRLAAAVGLTGVVSLLAAAESGSAVFAYSQPMASLAAWLRGPVSAPAAVRGKVAVSGWTVVVPGGASAGSTQQSGGSSVSP